MGALSPFNFKQKVHKVILQISPVLLEVKGSGAVCKPPTPHFKICYAIPGASQRLIQLGIQFNFFLYK